MPRKAKPSPKAPPTGPEAETAPKDANLIVRLPAAELKKFAAHAKRDGRTMSEIVRTDIWWQIRLRDHLDKKAKTK